MEKLYSPKTLLKMLVGMMHIPNTPPPPKSIFRGMGCSQQKVERVIKLKYAKDYAILTFVKKGNPFAILATPLFVRD